MENSDRQKFKILIVDDNRSDLYILFHTLRQEYDVIVANSGFSALKKAQNDEPDLILLDIMIPEISGYEVLSKLKESGATHDIPVIFITKLTSAEDETKGLQLGAVDYISKPFHIEIVKARIRAHLKIVSQIRTIEKLGMIDVLTDTANRRKFNIQLEIEWARALRERKPLSLLMFDLDGFRQYNNAYGQPAGDAALQAFANILRERSRRPADLPARLGGDEFAVLLPNTDINGAILIGEAVRAGIKALETENRELTVSGGAVCVIPNSASILEDFIAACGVKLKEARDLGRNKFCY